MNAPIPQALMASPPGQTEAIAPATEREELRRALLERVLKLSPSPSFDFKEVLTQARLVRAAGRALWRLVRPFRPDVLVGPGFGGSPLLFATAFAAAEEDGLDLSIWMVRDQRKTHYGKRWIEGPRLEGRPRAVMLDDFLGRGSAVELVDQALAAESMSAELCAIAVLFDSWSPLGSRQLSVGRCPVVSVFRRHDIGMTRDCHDARPPLMAGAAPAIIERPSWWRFEFNVGTVYPHKSAPAIADGAVYAADDRSRIWCFDGATGETRWQVDSLGRPVKGIVQRLQVVDRSLVVGCYDGTVTRLDAATGRLAWRLRVGAAVHATPVVDVANSRVFVNVETDDDGPGGHLRALDWATGKTIWRAEHASWAPGTPCHDAASGAVVASCNDRALTCVDAATGEPRWRATTDGLVRGQPALADGCAIVATESGWLQVFDLGTGALLRQRRYGDSKVFQFTHAEDGAVFTLDASGQLCAFDIATLHLRWLSTLRSEGTACPVPFGRHFIVLSRAGHLAAVERASGLKVWEGAIDARFSHAPAVGELAGHPALVCASNDAGLRAFRIHPYYSEPSTS